MKYLLLPSVRVRECGLVSYETQPTLGFYVQGRVGQETVLDTLSPVREQQMIMGGIILEQLNEVITIEAQRKANKEQLTQYVVIPPNSNEIIITRFRGAGDTMLGIVYPESKHVLETAQE